SRESALLLNNVFFTVSAAMVLLGTLYPLIIDFMNWGQISVGPPYFGAMFILLTTPVVVLLPLGPFTRWKRDRFMRAARPLALTAVGAIVAALIVCAWLDTWSLRAVSGWIGGIWLIGGATAYGVRTARASRSGLPRHQWGMVLAHAGVGVFLIGAAMVEAHTFEREVRIAPGETIEAAGYSFTLHEVAQVKGPNWRADEARITIHRGDRQVAHMTPQKRLYHRGGQTMTQVALKPGVFRDLYIAMGDRLDDSGAWSMRLHVKPFVRWIWGGAVLIGIGG